MKACFKFLLGGGAGGGGKAARQNDGTDVQVIRVNYIRCLFVFGLILRCYYGLGVSVIQPDDLIGATLTIFTQVHEVVLDYLG